MRIFELLLWAALLNPGLGMVLQAVETQPMGLDTPSETPSEPPKVLYVMDYDGLTDWEHVTLREGVTDGLIAWLWRLRDRLTVTNERPLGEYLRIPVQWWVPDVARIDKWGAFSMEDTSLRHCIRAQLEVDSTTVLLPKYLLVVYQMSMVPGGPNADDLHVTTAKTFWQVVEDSAAADKFVSSSHFDNDEEEATEVNSLQGFVVALPSHAPGVEHGQDSWQGASSSEQYGDHTAWDVRVIVQMLRKFFAVSGALSFPDVDEYEWRQDKFVIHDVLQAHYHKDPKHRFPPIPTRAVSIPIDRSSQHHLCYTARYSTAPAQVSLEEIRATAASLLRAVKQLEPDQDAQSMQHASQEKDGRPLRKYYIKRNYSGESKICSESCAQRNENE